MVFTKGKYTFYSTPTSSKFTFIREHDVYYADSSKKFCSNQVSASVFVTSALRKPGDTVGAQGIIGHFYDGWLSLSYLTLDYPIYCSICRDIMRLGEQSIQKTLYDMEYKLFVKLLIGAMIGEEYLFQKVSDVLLFFNDSNKYPIEFVEDVLGIQYEDPNAQDIKWYFELFSELGLCDLPDPVSLDL